MTHLEPNRPEALNAPVEAHVERGRIRIDVDATFERIIGALGTGPAIELDRLLGSHPGAWQFAHDPERSPAEADLELDTGLPPVHLDSVGRGDHAVIGLAAARFGLTYTNLSTSGNSYASQHRNIEALAIREPVGITAVDYPESARLCLGLVDEPTPGLARLIQTYTIPAGHYLIVSIGGRGGRQHRAACRTDRILTREALAAIPGARIDRVRATCGRCGRGWTGMNGSLALIPTENQSDCPWDVSTATGHDGASVSCPWAGCGGRVTFTN